MLVTLGMLLYEDNYRWKSPTNYLMMSLITLSFAVAIAGWTRGFAYETMAITFEVLIFTMVFIFAGALYTEKELDLMENLTKWVIGGAVF